MTVRNVDIHMLRRYGTVIIRTIYPSPRREIPSDHTNPRAGKGLQHKAGNSGVFSIELTGNTLQPAKQLRSMLKGQCILPIGAMKFTFTCQGIPLHQS